MRRARIFLAVVALFAWSVASAQTTGDISGRVTDASGTPLPGVTVEATSPSLPGTRVSGTGRDGLYRIPAIPPGAYRVAASLPGFPTVEKTCAVSLGSAMTVDLTLRLQAQARVVVSGETPLIDVTSTTTGTNYTSDVINRLPVGRNYADIVRANPGVSLDYGDTQGRFVPLAIYGATSAENQWIIDGVNTTFVKDGIQGKSINNEFVQEVEVKTGGYQAEYGRALGGVINVITKSGGNAYHGDAFSYFDSSGTAAQQQIKPEDSGLTMRTTSSKRLDYGADLGGFLVKDRLWLFGAYDRVTLDGQVARVASATYVSKDDRFQFSAVDNLYSGKLTWNAAPSTTVVGTVFADPSSTSGAAGADPRLGSASARAIVSPDPSTWYSARSQGGTDFGVRVTQLFGARALATVQGGYHQDGNSLVAADTIQYTDWTCAGGTPEAHCAFPPEPNSILGGYGGLYQAASSREQYAGSLSLYAGTHEFKTGGDYWNGQSNDKQRYTGGQLVQIFNEWGPTYYAHRYFAVSLADPTPIPYVKRGAQVLDYGAYLQDLWKALPHLTISVGLRWDGETTRNYAGQTVFRFGDAFQPRLGVAWDPRGDSATKIYAFAGRFSYGLPTSAATGYFSNLTSRRSFNFDPVSVIQDPTVPHHGRLTGGGGINGAAVDAGIQASYQDELTVGIERMLGTTLTIGLKGTYRRLGEAFEDRCDLDYSSPDTGYNQCAFINPGSNGRFASGNIPTCNGLYDDDLYQCYPAGLPTPPARRLYRGIELLARKALGDKLWLQASYIYSSLRGNYDGAVNEGVYSQIGGQTTPGATYDFDYPTLWHNSYGPLTLDRPNRFRFDGYWVTPIDLSVGLQSWVESGAPMNKLGYFNGAGSVFLVPRGSAGRLPTFWEANLTLAYPVPIGPMTATLQAYIYNLFNNQIETSRDQQWTISPPAGFPANIYDPNQPQNNPDYGKATSRSAPRSFRAALRVSF